MCRSGSPKTVISGKADSGYKIHIQRQDHPEVRDTQQQMLEDSHRKGAGYSEAASIFISLLNNGRAPSATALEREIHVRRDCGGLAAGAGGCSARGGTAAGGHRMGR